MVTISKKIYSIIHNNITSSYNCKGEALSRFLRLLRHQLLLSSLALLSSSLLSSLALLWSMTTSFFIICENCDPVKKPNHRRSKKKQNDKKVFSPFSGSKKSWRSKKTNFYKIHDFEAGGQKQAQAEASSRFINFEAASDISRNTTRCDLIFCLLMLNIKLSALPKKLLNKTL